MTAADGAGYSGIPLDTQRRRLAESVSCRQISTVRATGLKAEVAGSACRSRCSKIFLTTIGASMLAITLTAPPQWSQVIDREHPLQALRPRHRDVAYGDVRLARPLPVRLPVIS